MQLASVAPRRWGSSLVIGIACVALLVAESAWGQRQYESLPVDDSMSRYGLSARRYARSPTADAAERQRFGQYVLNYYLPLMTQPDTKSLSELAKNRYDFFRGYIWAADPAVQQLLTPEVMKIMQRVATGNQFHPAVRYNAVLIIGMLDAKYSDGGSPPEPYPPANTLLTAIVKQGIENRAAPAPLVVGALVGLERHAKVLGSLPSANQTETRAALLAVLQKDELPQEMAASVEQWIKIMAARGLAATGSLGDANEVHDALVAMLANDAMRLDNRVRLAALMGGFKPAYEAGPTIDGRKATEAVLKLASDIAADEKQRATKYEETMLRGGGVGAMDYGFDLDVPDEYQVRRIVKRLRGLRTAVNAVQPAISDEQLSALLNQITAAINPVIATAQNKNVIELNLAGDVKVMADQVIAAAESLGVEAAEPPAEGEEDLDDELLGG